MSENIETLEDVASAIKVLRTQLDHAKESNSGFIEAVKTAFECYLEVARLSIVETMSGLDPNSKEYMIQANLKRSTKELETAIMNLVS